MNLPVLQPFRISIPHLCVVLGVVALQSPLQAQSAKSHGKTAPTAKASASPSPSGELPAVVAVVNGENISRDDLMKVAKALLSANGRSVEELNAADKRHMYESVLDEIISDRLISKAAAAEPVDEMEVEKQFNQITKQYPNPEAIDAALKKAGSTQDQVKENIRNQLKQTNWINQKTADDIKVEPLEVEKFYNENPPSKFDTPEMIRASHILIAVRKDATPEALMVAQDKMKKLTELLAKGQSFESLAKQFSDDPQAKQNGGDLDYFSRERIMPEFADAAFKLKIGEVSQPVRTQFGLHLIKLTDRRPSHVATLVEARDQIISFLQTEKRKQAVAALIESLKASAKIDNKLKPATAG